MHVRPTTRADLPALVQISHDAFLDDEINAYLWPDRHAHSADYKRTLAHSARASLATRALHGAVALSDPADKALFPHTAALPPGTLLGFAWWDRTATPAAYASASRPLSATHDARTARASEARARAHNASPLAALERALLGIEDAYRARVSPDRSACPPGARTALHTAAGPAGALDALPGHWHLTLLGVQPCFRGRGVAGALVEWGMARAQAEGVPCALGSSLSGMRVYARYGFRVVDWVALPGGIQGGAVMVWDPWGVWVEGLPEGREVVVGGHVMDAVVKGAVGSGAS